MAKLTIDRWQWDEIITLLLFSDRIDFEDVWKHMEANYELRKLPQTGTDIPNVYIFYGYKQDAVKWRLENDVDIKDVVLARDWRKLEGRRARPIVVNQGSEWSKNNWLHEFSVNTRRMVIHMESYYGSAE